MHAIRKKFSGFSSLPPTLTYFVRHHNILIHLFLYLDLDTFTRSFRVYRRYIMVCYSSELSWRRVPCFNTSKRTSSHKRNRDILAPNNWINYIFWEKKFFLTAKTSKFAILKLCDLQKFSRFSILPPTLNILCAIIIY